MAVNLRNRPTLDTKKPFGQQTEGFLSLFEVLTL